VSSSALVAPQTVKVRITRRGVEWSIIVFHHFVSADTGRRFGQGNRNQGNVPIGVKTAHGDERTLERGMFSECFMNASTERNVSKSSASLWKSAAAS
jgi:hypothetical protein